MRQVIKSILLTILMSMVGAKAFALTYDIAVKNADGITIYYNYINDGKELEVTNSLYGYLGNIVIPEDVTYMNRTRKVTRISEEAFHGMYRLTSVTIPNSVTTIEDYAFYGCNSLTSITIPNSLTSIGKGVFFDCHFLTLTIPNSVTSIGEMAFYDCFSLGSVIIPSSVTSIGEGAFMRSGLTSITIPNSVTDIGKRVFKDSGLSSITIPNSVTNIGKEAFYGCSGLTSVVSLIEKPFPIFPIEGKIDKYITFSSDTYYNATLYVPIGTIDKYKSTDGWKEFLFIEEGTDPSGDGNTPTVQKCAKPNIIYQNGKLTFKCDTEGAVCQSTITDSDITSYSSNEVQLGVTYHISVYATKLGYEDSDIATATLCWIEVDPKTEGITNIVSSVRARAVLIQSNGNQLTISGADEGTAINVFDISGKPAGSAKVSAETTTVNTSLRSGDIGIVKIGEKAIKVLIK